MNKGINLQIEEFKNNLSKVINESNMPIGFVEMTIQSLLYEIGMVKRQQLEKEKHEFEKVKEEDIKQ